MLKGQASLEYLLISLIGLALLSLSVVSLKGIASSAFNGGSAIAFRDSALQLATAIDEVCLLGNGNGQTVVLPMALSIYSEQTSEQNGDADLDGGAWAVRFSSANGNFTTVRLSHCELSEQDAEIKEKIYIKNTGGKISLQSD